MKHPLEHEIKCLFRGELRKVGELKPLPDGQCAVKFTVRCEPKGSTLVLECRLFNNDAKLFYGEARAGDTLLMEGSKLSACSYVDTNGEVRPVQNFIPEKVVILD